MSQVGAICSGGVANLELSGEILVHFFSFPSLSASLSMMNFLFVLQEYLCYHVPDIQQKIFRNYFKQRDISSPESKFFLLS